MAIVLAGAFVLLFVLGLGYAFTRADPATLARALRYLGVVLLALIALGLAFAERLSLALLLGTVAWTLFTQGRLWPRGWPAYGAPSGAPRHRSASAKSSAVRTAWIALELDHTTGDMDGKVLQGANMGMRLSAMSRDALASLYREAQSDAETIRLLDVYLDRRFGAGWREAEQTQSRSKQHNGSSMSRDEALRVLGLEPGADAAAIRAAHRKLMLQNHPDKGGSSYLAAKINEAKDVLLGS